MIAEESSNSMRDDNKKRRAILHVERITYGSHRNASMIETFSAYISFRRHFPNCEELTSLFNVIDI